MHFFFQVENEIFFKIKKKSFHFFRFLPNFFPIFLQKTRRNRKIPTHGTFLFLQIDSFFRFSGIFPLYYVCISLKNTEFSLRPNFISCGRRKTAGRSSSKGRTGPCPPAWTGCPAAAGTGRYRPEGPPPPAGRCRKPAPCTRRCSPRSG